MRNSTQFTILTFLALILTAGAAFADFVPGRVRPGLRAEMVVAEATGAFADVKAATMTMNYMDGSRDAVSVTLLLPGKSPITMLITNLQASSCGDKTTAATMNPTIFHTSVELVDYSKALCEIMLPGVWMATVHANDSHGESTLSLHGNPVALVQTL